jgi:hypothetical protein
MNLRRTGLWLTLTLTLLLGAVSCGGSSSPQPPEKPVITAFSATPASIEAGGSSRLAWSVSGADSLTLEPGIGTVSGTSATVLPTATTTYTLTARNAGGTATATAQVVVSPAVNPNIALVYNWFKSVQLANGLVPSCECGDSNYAISLYDQALSSMAFLAMGDTARAQKVLDVFNGRVDSELKAGKGGFWQFRPRSGVPAKIGSRWLGDNAFLLAAIYSFQAQTGDNLRYAAMRDALQAWIVSLQDTDGGLFSGYRADDTLNTLKVTEGNIDAFGAIPGYTAFHAKVLAFFKSQRWDTTDRMLISWVGSPNWKYATDNVSWAYCAIDTFPTSTFLYAEAHFATTKTATQNGATLTGFGFDADKDTINPEASMGMAVAYRLAGNESKAGYYLAEAEKELLPGTLDPSARGLPYGTNPGTAYADDVLAPNMIDRPWVSGSAWYLFAQKGYNPFAYARARGIPAADQFWNE